MVVDGGVTVAAVLLSLLLLLLLFLWLLLFLFFVEYRVPYRGVALHAPRPAPSAAPRVKCGDKSTCTYVAHSRSTARLYDTAIYCAYSSIVSLFMLESTTLHPAALGTEYSKNKNRS